MAFLPIFVSIISAVIISVILIYIFRGNPRVNPLDVYPNQPIIINPTKTQFTENGFILLEKDLKVNKNGTCTLQCYKLDHRQGEFAPKLKLYKFVTLKDNLITIGTIGDRVIKILVGKNAGDYPEELLKTNIGQAMLKTGMANYLKEMSEEAHKEKDRTVRSMFIDNSYGEATGHTYGRMKEAQDKLYDLMASMNKKQEEK